LQTYKYVYINNKFLFGCNDFAQLQNPNPRLPLMRQFIMLSAKQLGGILQIHTYILGFVHFSINAPIYIYIGSTESRQTRVALTKPVGNGLANGIYCNGVLKTKSSSSNQIHYPVPPVWGLSRWGVWGLRTIDTLSTSSFNIYAHL